MSDIGKIITELQVNGISSTPKKGNRGRKGGAGPSDHRALTIEGKTVMVPVYKKILIINFQRSLTDNLFSRIVKIRSSRNYLPQKNQIFIL